MPCAPPTNSLTVQWALRPSICLAWNWPMSKATATIADGGGKLDWSAMVEPDEDAWHA